jgi:cyclopropane-fatty-acyl-phospholipid synthase
MFRRVMHHGSWGLGESYLDGDWDCDALDELMHRLMRQEERLLGEHRWALPVMALRDGMRALHHRLVNRQTRRRAYAVGEHHYDAGNALFERMLDPLMQYSCAYWGRATTLEAAQRDKVALVAAKLQLQPGQRVLDIGCGWGGLAATLAQQYGVTVTGLTVSREQQAWAQRRREDLPVTIELADWREHQPAHPYDRIVSVGMFEHVGPHNHRAFLQRARQWLAPDGLFLLHTIGLHRTTATTDAWIDRHIFPNGKLPSARELTRAAEGVFLIEDWHNFGSDYDRTLMAWHERLERAWPALSAAEPDRYTARHRRMWRYYLLSCAGFFRSRQGQLWQLVLAGPERPQAYRSVRFDAVAEPLA